jgi:two-component system, OmpR family, alkaline phosphatase synthesis response regulator PhoP
MFRGGFFCNLRNIMSKAHILAVDDEEDILEVIRYNLEREGYKVTCAESGEKALALIRSQIPDLVVLDLMLPGLDGLDVCRHVKATPETAHVPVIMLTARSEEVDLVTGLELGADDYITKPFSPRVLSARVKAVLRRRRTQPDASVALQFGELLILPEQHAIRVSGQPVELTATEFRILHTLARRPGWVFSREQIVDATQGTNVAVTSRSIDVHIVSLRRKLGVASDYIETIRGVGYRFRENVDE